MTKKERTDQTCAELLGLGEARLSSMSRAAG